MTQRNRLQKVSSQRSTVTNGNTPRTDLFRILLCPLGSSQLVEKEQQLAVLAELKEAKTKERRAEWLVSSRRQGVGHSAGLVDTGPFIEKTHDLGSFPPLSPAETNRGGWVRL